MVKNGFLTDWDTPMLGVFFYWDIKMSKQEPLWASLVLGMHDALVSTLGLITGLVFAATPQHIIVLTGLIAAVSAGLSMTASEYLSQKTDGNTRNAIWRGIMTGIAYIFSAFMLLVPFMFFKNSFINIVITYLVGALIIFIFNYLKSLLTGQRFWGHFAEMLIICTIVTTVAFLIGETAKMIGT